MNPWLRQLWINTVLYPYSYVNFKISYQWVSIVFKWNVVHTLNTTEDFDSVWLSNQYHVGVSEYQWYTCFFLFCFGKSDKSIQCRKDVGTPNFNHFDNTPIAILPGVKFKYISSAGKKKLYYNAKLASPTSILIIYFFSILAEVYWNSQ